MFWLILYGDTEKLCNSAEFRVKILIVKVRENVRSILSEIRVNLTFADVYDEEYPVFEKSLSWFKREL